VCLLLNSFGTSTHGFGVRKLQIILSKTSSGTKKMLDANLSTSLFAFLMKP
jgi:hypothetical protein